jgi:hypothetical protein
VGISPVDQDQPEVWFPLNWCWLNTHRAPDEHGREFRALF